MNTLILSSDIVRALGWAILHSLWQAFLIYTCLRVVLKLWPEAGARIRHNLSLLSLTGIFIWFLATFYIQLDRIIEARSLLLISSATVPLQNFDIITPVVYPSQHSLLYLIPNLEHFFPYLVGVYILGMGMMIIKLGSDLFQLQRIRTLNTEPIGDAWQKYVQKLAAQLQIPKKVSLLISHQVTVPVMLGFFKPLILVPIAMVNNLTEVQLEAVLLHELAHIKRNDYLLNIFQSIVETILFFNPFIWMISKVIRIEREHCCDDLVIANTAQPIQYAHALVALAEHKLNANRLTMAAANSKQHLFHRIKRIMEMKTRHLNYTQKFLAVLIIASSLVSIAWLNPAKGKNSESNQPKNKQQHSDSDTTKVSNKQFTYQTIVTAVDTLNPGDQSGSIAPKSTAKSTVIYQVVDTSGDHIRFPPPPPAAPSAPKKPSTPPSQNGVRFPPPPPPAAPPTPPTPPKYSASNVAVSSNRNGGHYYSYNTNYVYTDTLIDKEDIKRQIQLAQKNVQVAMQQLKQVDMKKLQADVQAATANINTTELSENVKKAYAESLAALKNINWDEISNAQKEAALALKNINLDSLNTTISLAMNSLNLSNLKVELDNAMASANLAARDMAHRNSEGAESARKKAESARERAEIIRDKAESARHEAMYKADEAKREAKAANANSQQLKNLVKKLEADNLLDTKSNYSIERKGEDLLINGVKQSNNVLDKYRSYFPSKNVTIKGGNDTFNIYIQN
ncbi:hypothetical protein DVR12_18470 [Chitinophaga silvatica]|uniref:Peptidase M56 domain-containing protein n=1 Tax=Chitinophaga silvatica TaxID=2282649 RepID=A0A3E1Y6I9_9BACT|nr:M56 family metallopeptidase [Chitinophaga silvatica]RFS20550.1 hypothetical protein DVR12_18470 [Chitinophaga silvatica]